MNMRQMCYIFIKIGCNRKITLRHNKALINNKLRKMPLSLRQTPNKIYAWYHNGVKYIDTYFSYMLTATPS